jgi:hypothetical protein
MMLASSTNKPRISPHAFERLSQPDLHAKILSLVANRMQPSSSALLLMKDGCGSCVTPSPAATKRNSLAATRTKELKHKANQTVCEGSDGRQAATRKEEEHRRERVSSIPLPLSHTQQLLAKQARKLKISSKVVFVSVDHAKVGDFTIDLRREMPTEFVNVKMMNKLRV